MSASQDVSERELLLLEAERVAKVGSWVRDFKTGALGWSDEMFRILGLDPKVHVASAENFFARVVPEDLARVKAAASAAAATGDIASFDYKIRRPDGEIRILRGQGGCVRDANGAPLRLIGSLRDVTEDRRREDELQRTIEQLIDSQRLAGVGTWIRDFETEQNTWSDTLYSIFGMTPSTPPSRTAFMELIHPDDRERVERARARIFDTGAAEALEFRIVRPDGELRDVLFKATAVRSPDGRLRRVIGCVLDLTERRRIEHQLRQSQKMEAIGRLAGGIAHDFNNLLTVMLGNVELLRASHPRAELDEIARAVESGADLTRQLLLFSRGAVAERVVLDLAEVTDETQRLIARVIGEDIRLEFERPAGPALIEANHSQIQQVLLNLATNGRDAMPNGGTLRFEVSERNLNEADASRMPDASPGPCVVLTVTDSGVGMAEDVRSHIFEPFFTTKGHGQGTGLGLATVFGIVRHWGGWIDVESHVGLGTKLSLYFKRASGTVTAVPVPRTRKPTYAGTETILLVEDNTAVQSLTARMLENQGYRVKRAASANAVLASWDHFGDDIALLVTDVVMPGMSGPELAREVRRTKLDLPVLFITGWGATETFDASLSRYEVLNKPFGSEALLQAVRRLLDGA